MKNRTKGENNKDTVLKFLRNLIGTMMVLTWGLFLAALPAAAETMPDPDRDAEDNIAAYTIGQAEEHGWVDFFLMSNEGMSNRGGNAGNTSMVVALNEHSGTIRLMMFTWDTFIRYEGYDLPQKLDMAYRNAGPEETMKVFNDNFDLGVKNFMSLNYLNLATLIDAYEGVNVEVTRAERNALNSMVASKKENIQAMADDNLLEQIAVDLLADEYYLNEFGPDTHLNGLQAVGYGWLRYDSVYNCCERELEVVAGLFRSVGSILKEEIAFYTDEYDRPELADSRRIINLDHVSDDDMAFIRQAISPIFNTAYHNLSEEEIASVTLALARTSYHASRQGADILDRIETAIFPLEAQEPYELVAGAEGHLIDYEKNGREMRKFLYHQDEGR